MLHQTLIKRFKFVLSSALLVTGGLISGMDGAIARSRYPHCQVANPDEYVLLVVTKTPQNRELVRQALPRNTKFTLCNYSNDVVMRISGFMRQTEAENWVRYLKEIVGLQAVVVNPPVVVQATPSTSSPSVVFATRREEQRQTRAAETVPAYSPQPLGAGYAVLVDYFNQPDIADRIEQLLGKEVGLVSFGQRSYLLVLYTPNERNASNTFQLLNDRGFYTILVDAQKVRLVRSRVLLDRPRN